MQNAQATQGMESMHMVPQNGAAATLKQEVSNASGFDYISVCEVPNQKATFMSPSNSSSSTFNTPQIGDADKVSSCVNMLKGTLERKRLNSHVEKEGAEDNSNGIFCGFAKSVFMEGPENWVHEKPNCQVKDPGVLQTLEGSMNLEMDGFANQTNTVYVGTASREPSQSESSAACEGPSNSGQTLCESSWKQVGVSRISENRVKGMNMI